MFATVEGIDERVAVRVNIKNKGKIIFPFGQKALECLGFGLREGGWTREESRALVVDSIGVGQLFKSFETLIFQIWVHLTKIHAEVPIQINTLVNLGAVCAGSQARGVLGVHVFPIRRNSAILFPLIFDICNSVNVENGHKYILVLIEKLFPLLIFFDDALLQQLEHLVDVK